MICSTLIENEKMLYLIVGTLVVFFLIYWFFYKTNNNQQEEDSSSPPSNSTPPAAPDPSSMREAQKDILTTLARSGATLYGADWCGFTRRQFDVLGVTSGSELAAAGIKYVDCDNKKNAKKCGSVDGFPTWKIGSTVTPGFKSISQLKSLSKQ